MTSSNLSEDEQLELFKVLVQQSPIPLVAIEHPGHTFCFWNDAAELLLGYSPEEMLGKPVTTIIPPDVITEEEHKRLVDRFVQGAQRRDMGREAKLISRTKEGRRIQVGIRVFRVKIGDRMFVGEAIRDMTDEETSRAQLEQAKATLKARTEQLQATNAKLEKSQAKMELQLRRSQTQKDIVIWLLGTCIFFYTIPMVLNVFVRLPPEMMSLGRDAIIILLSAIGGAVSGIFGFDRGQKEERNRAEEEEKIEPKKSQKA